MDLLTPALSSRGLSNFHIFFAGHRGCDDAKFFAMVLYGRVFSPELLERLEQAGRLCSRRQLARQLCEWLDWRNPGGSFQLMSGRKALAQLVGRGQLRLPPAQVFGAVRSEPVGTATPSSPVTPLSG